MLSNSVREALRDSGAIATKLDELVGRPGGFQINSDADWMLASQWALNASIHVSVLTLFDANLPAGAFALLRPICETLVRVHLIAMNDIGAIEQMRADKFKLKFFKHPEKVDAHFGLGGRFKSFYDRITVFMHSTVHMGLEQTKRQFSGSDLAPNYRDGEIVAVVAVCTFAKFMVASRTVERFGDAAEQREVTALFQHFKF